MAGSPRQYDHYDAEGRFDWDTPFKERMNELRARLRSVEVAVLRLSQLRWEQVAEVMMAIWAHTLPTGETKAATSRIMQTSGLTRRQYYTALAIGKQIGLVEAVTNYTLTERQCDRLRLNQRAIDELIAESRRRRATGEQRVPAGTSGEQRVPAGTSGEQRVPAGTTLKVLKEPKNLTASSTSTRMRAKRRLSRTIEEVEEAVKKIGVDCRELKAAVRQAVRVGKCQRQQLIERVAWFGQRLSHYAPEHRGGALCNGLRDAKHGMDVREGWPYSENFLEQEARRDREREKQRLAAEQQRASRRAIQDSFERSRQREREFGPALNALSDDELAALEMQCFHSRQWADKCRGLTAYRDVLLTALANRAEKGTMS